jgi:hypothetical protein
MQCEAWSVLRIHEAGSVRSADSESQRGITWWKPSEFAISRARWTNEIRRPNCFQRIRVARFLLIICLGSGISFLPPATPASAALSVARDYLSTPCNPCFCSIVCCEGLPSYPLQPLLLQHCLLQGTTFLPPAAPASAALSDAGTTYARPCVHCSHHSSRKHYIYQHVAFMYIISHFNMICLTIRFDWTNITEELHQYWIMRSAIPSPVSDS